MDEKEVCRPRVVAVDDDAGFLMLIRRWLESKYEVTTLTGGGDAGAEIAALDPDLLIMDVHMPERGGFQLSRQLRTQTGFEDLPVIFLTGSKSDRDFLLYLDFAGCRYMTKPVSGQELREAVAEELGLQMVG